MKYALPKNSKSMEFGGGANSSPHFRLTPFCDAQMGGLRGAEAKIIHNLRALLEKRKAGQSGIIQSYPSGIPL